jgi:hypothetical protein
MSAGTSVDMLDSRAETWQRDTWTQPQRIEDTPTWWRQVADIEDRAGYPDKAVQYRRMADLLDAALVRVTEMPS